MFQEDTTSDPESHYPWQWHVERALFRVTSMPMLPQAEHFLPGYSPNIIWEYVRVVIGPHYTWHVWVRIWYPKSWNIVHFSQMPPSHYSAPCPFLCYQILFMFSPQASMLYILLIAIWLKCPFFGGHVSGQSLLPLGDWAKVYIPHSAPVCVFSGCSHTVILCLGQGCLHLPLAMCEWAVSLNRHTAFLASMFNLQRIIFPIINNICSCPVPMLCIVISQFSWDVSRTHCRV